MGTPKPRRPGTPAAVSGPKSRKPRGKTQNDFSTLTPHNLQAAARTLLAVAASWKWGDGPPQDGEELDRTTLHVLRALQDVTNTLEAAANKHREKSAGQAAIVALVAAIHDALARSDRRERPLHRPLPVRNDILGPQFVPPAGVSGVPERLVLPSDWQIELNSAAATTLATEAGQQLGQAVRVALAELRRSAPSLHAELRPKHERDAVNALLLRGNQQQGRSEEAKQFAKRLLGLPLDTAGSVERWLKDHRSTAAPVGDSPQAMQLGRHPSPYFFRAPQPRPFFCQLLAPLGGPAIARAAMAELPPEEQLVAAVGGCLFRYGIAETRHLTARELRIREAVLSLAEALAPPERLQDLTGTPQTAMEWCSQGATEQAAHPAVWAPVLSGGWCTDDWHLPPDSGGTAATRPSEATARTLAADDNPGA